ncbi:MAG: hypothetical protein V7L20_10845 [Nostoc sp.]
MDRKDCATHSCWTIWIELPIDTFPVECPYSIARILDAEFLPDAIDS